MAATKLGQAGCGCSGDGDCCPLTINLVDCDGSPISGATISGEGTGTTDGSGNFTLPTSASSFTVTYEGFSQTFSGGGCTVGNCTTPLNLCYRHATVNVTPSAPATITTTCASTSSSVSGSTTSYTYQSIAGCGSPSIFPESCCFTATPDDPTTYITNCVCVTINCGDDTSITIDIFDFPSGYVEISSCDLGCEANGEGPNNRGLAPKTLFLTFSAEAGGVDTTADWFGTLGTVTVVWDGVSLWDSGCQPFDAPCHLNQPGPPTPTYGSYRARLGDSGGTWLLEFAYFAFAGGAGLVAPGCPNFNIQFDINPCSICSPVDYTVTLASDTGTTFTVHITE